MRERTRAAGLLIVRVSFNRFARLDGTGMHGYAYRWPFDRAPQIGDVVRTGSKADPSG